MVYVRTGDKRFAGTDANVFIQICGEKSITKKHNLDDEKNNFERGMLDVFQVTRHDNYFYLNWNFFPKFFIRPQLSLVECIRSVFKR